MLEENYLIIKKTKFPDVIIFIPKLFKDHRGVFFESYRKSLFNKNGIDYDFFQDNQVESKKGVLRGLHYQLNQPQGKLVKVVYGEIFDVIVDIRKKSPTFGESLKVKLDSKNHKMIFVPPGYAHGYIVRSDKAIVSYKCTAEYAPNDQFGIIWNDPNLNIDWELKNPILSDSDLNWPTLKLQNKLPIF
tara:strand:- start:441 stop:1004 length:564 start_codon:yes stop_codon:yes gene_type:complete